MKKIIFLVALAIGLAAEPVDDVVLTESVCKDVILILKEAITQEKSDIIQKNVKILLQCFEIVAKPTSDKAIKECVSAQQHNSNPFTGDPL